jgi:hypothetical protein
MSTTAPRSDAAAAAVGASDLFVLRRVTGSRFVHFGGSGRGAGWAGLIEVSADEETALAEALRTRRPVRVDHGGKELVFGPYYARAAAFVPVTNDVVVVFGCEGGELGSATDESLQSAATLGAEAVGSVSPAKLLADELEELEAVRGLAAIRTDDVAVSMREVAAVTARSLSCEVAAVYLENGNRFALVSEGWDLQAPEGDVAAALRGVLGDHRFPYCVQDAAVVPLPAPLDREPGIRSYYLLELQGVARGVLFVAHTDAAPRGFTTLCRRLGARLAGVASAQLGVALTQTWCSEEASRLHAAFGQLDLA